MDRNDEYEKLTAELEDTPLKLDFTLDRARLRLKDHRRRVKKAVFVPICTVLAVFLIFTALVNFSEPFADACGNIPVVDRLAEAVSMSQPLSAAVENGYAQEIGQEQTANGVTASIEYVIVDQKELVIFYSLSSDKYPIMDARIKLPGSRSGSIQSDFSPDTEDGALRKIVVTLNGDDIPGTLKLVMTVNDRSSWDDSPTPDTEEGVITAESSPPVIAEFDFTLNIDPESTSAGESLNVGRTFELDGRTLTLDTVEIYPTHMCFSFSQGESNTAWLKNLSFYVENGEGEIFKGGSTTSGTKSSVFTVTMESSAYFYDMESLTMCITGATWYDKDMEHIHVDLAGGTAEGLPDGVELGPVMRTGEGWKFYLTWPWTWPPEEKGDTYYLNINGIYDSGSERISNWETSGTGGPVTDEDTNDTIGGDGMFTDRFTLSDYGGSEIWIDADLAHILLHEDDPIEVKIK